VYLVQVKPATDVLSTATNSGGFEMCEVVDEVNAPSMMEASEQCILPDDPGAPILVELLNGVALPEQTDIHLRESFYRSGCTLECAHSHTGWHEMAVPKGKMLVCPAGTRLRYKMPRSVKIV
jgi:hypothetical protein